MSETKVAALKEALSAQQELLKKLYNELDVEREASSTAASEALSMILRLQGEKASVKMEAEQYKRLAEEKMSYAEETMEIFEDLVYQKEMEVSALDFQVQAFRDKLLCLGYDDPGDGEIDFPEDLMQRSEALIGETSDSSTSRRNFASLVPPARLSSIKTGIREGSESLDDDLIVKEVENQSDEISGLEKQFNIFGAGNINSYWEQIRKLDDRVREITGEPHTRVKSPSPPKQVSTIRSLDSMEGTSSDYDQIKHPDNLLEKEVCTNSSSPICVHDVFEVPQAPEIFAGGDELSKKEGKSPLQDSDQKGAKPNLISKDVFSQFLNDQVDCADKKLTSKHRELNLSPPSDGGSVDCHSKIVQSTTSTCKDKLHQANKLSEVAEIQRQTLRPECSNNDTRVELQLLNEIQKQLNSIQSEIKSLKPKKSSSLDNLHMHSLREDLLHFWL